MPRSTQNGQRNGKAGAPQDPQPTKSYLVQWEIDVDAVDVLDAARKARAAQTRPGTLAMVFDVFQDNHFKGRVDLVNGEVTQ